MFKVVKNFFTSKTTLFALLADFSFLVLQRVKGLFHQMSLLSVQVNFEIGEMALV